MAAREGKVDVIKYFLEFHRDKIQIDSVMMDNWTPFFYASVNGYLLTVDVLAKEGKCNVNHMDKFNRTALHWAARYNNVAMVRKLLDLGVNYDIKDVEGLSAFDLAKLNGSYEVAQMISQHQ